MKLFFRKLGKGKPLFILHGLFGLSDNWSTIGKKLSEDFSVYLIDLRNHGNSPHSNEWTYPSMAEDVEELMENERLGKIILMGHSMGGKVAMQFAVKHSGKIEKLIVADMAPKEYPVTDTTFTDNLLAVNLLAFSTRKEVEEKLFSFIKDKAVLQLMQKNLGWNKNRTALKWKFNLQVIAREISSVGKTFSIGEKPCRVPVLFIRGEKSNYIPDADVLLIKKHFPRAVFAILQNAGHWLHIEKPEEFVHFVKEFALN